MHSSTIVLCSFVNTHIRILARMMIYPIPYRPLLPDGAKSFRRLPFYRDAFSHAAIKTQRLVVCTTMYSFAHNHALSGHLVHHNLAMWVGRLHDIVDILPTPPDGANYSRRWRTQENKMAVLFCSVFTIPLPSLRDRHNSTSHVSINFTVNTS